MMPMPRPMLTPTTVAAMPRTRVLARAFFISGHTGRLPLMELPQLPVRKWPSQWKYCSGGLPMRPLTSLYCWIFSGLARGLTRR